MKDNQRNKKLFLYKIFFLGGLSVLLGSLCFWNKSILFNSSSSLKIVVLNSERLWNELPAMQDLKQTLTKELESYHREFSSIEETLRQENQKLLEDQRLLSGKNSTQARLLGDRQKAFTDKVMQTQKSAENRQKTLNENHEHAMQSIKLKVNDQVKHIAQGKGAELVIFHTQTPYYDPSLDITEEVLKKLKDFRVKISKEV